MLEIPEAMTVSQQLDSALKGKRIQNVTANRSPHGFTFYFGDPNGYRELLCGKTVTAAKAQSGMAELAAEDTRLLFGDGVNIRYYAEGEPIPAKHQLHVEFEDFSSIVCTVQMYGGIWAFPNGQNDNPYYAAAKEKPSPLTDRFDEEYFGALFRAAKPSISVKALLATEQRIPGLGNGVLHDILWNAGIHPKTKLAELSGAQTGLLFRSVKDTLREMTAKGGRDTEKDIYGVSGGYKTILSAKTINGGCPACGGAISRQAYMGGNVYFCESCQPLSQKG